MGNFDCELTTCIAHGGEEGCILPLKCRLLGLERENTYLKRDTRLEERRNLYAENSRLRQENAELRSRLQLEGICNDMQKEVNSMSRETLDDFCSDGEREVRDGS